MQDPKKAETRRKKVMELASEGHTHKEIGAVFHISRERVRQLIKNAKWIDQHPCLGMDRRVYNAIARALEIESLSLIDIQNFIEKNPDWRKKMLRFDRIGPVSLNELEKICMENGILVDAHSSVGKSSRKE